MGTPLRGTWGHGAGIDCYHPTKCLDGTAGPPWEKVKRKVAGKNILPMGSLQKIKTMGSNASREKRENYSLTKVVGMLVADLNPRRDNKIGSLAGTSVKRALRDSPLPGCFGWAPPAQDTAYGIGCLVCGGGWGVGVHV